VSKPLISVVISVYNEEECLPVVYEALCRVASAEPDVAWEFLFVDDGSKDGSLALLRGLNVRDARVKVLSFSRNFGAHETTTAGLRACSGDAAIATSSDMQDPPETMHDFLRHWRQGYEVVLGVRGGRSDESWRQWSARAFTWLVRTIAVPEFPRNGTGGYFLLSRNVINAYNALGERNRLTTGLILWLGFSRVEVEYHRAKRHAGYSRYGITRLFKTAADMILAFSAAPIRLITLTGAVTILAGLLAAVGLVAAALVFGGAAAWAPVVAMMVLSGWQLVAVGILGEYQWRLLDEGRARPAYIVKEWIGEFPHVKRDEQSLGRAA
jgi:dolichol-phosphate mannosyltransferase